MEESGIDLRLEPFDSRTDTGFRPAKMKGQDCGFEYSFSEVDAEKAEEGRNEIGDRNRVVTLIARGGVETDGRAAQLAAAVLATITDGIYYGPGDGHARGAEVWELLRQEEQFDLQRRQRLAMKDVALTDRRCPTCGCPAPSYRKTCKACQSPLA